jgi:hypothetical protein
MNRVRDHSKSQVQFAVNPTHLPSVFQLIRRETEARQHNNQDEAIPDLQPPFDGFGDHGWETSNIEHRTSNAQLKISAPRCHSMFSVRCWMFDVFIYSMQ